MPRRRQPRVESARRAPKAKQDSQAILVVWARVNGHPFWPAKLVDSDVAVPDDGKDEEEDEDSPGEEEDKKTNYRVQFFDESSTTAVVQEIFEFTGQMGRMRAAGAYVQDVVLACRRACVWIYKNGTQDQLDVVESPYFMVLQLRELDAPCVQMQKDFFRRKSVFVPDPAVDARLLEHTLNTEPPMEPGLVVFSRLPGYPTWPAMVIQREWWSLWAPGASDAPTGKNHVYVKYFNDNDYIYPVERNSLLEYTANMAKLDEAPEKDLADVKEACRQANTFIMKNGTLYQRKRVAEPGFSDVLLEPTVEAAEELPSTAATAAEPNPTEAAAQQEVVDPNAPIPDGDLGSFSVLLNHPVPTGNLPGDDGVWSDGPAPNALDEPDISGSEPAERGNINHDEPFFATGEDGPPVHNLVSRSPSRRGSIVELDGEPSGRGDVNHDSAISPVAEDGPLIQDLVSPAPSSRGSTRRRVRRSCGRFVEDQRWQPRSNAIASPARANGQRAITSASRGRSADKATSLSTAAMVQLDIKRRAAERSDAAERTSRRSPSHVNGNVAAAEAGRVNGRPGRITPPAPPPAVDVSFRTSAFKAHLQKLEASKGVLNTELAEMQSQEDDLQRQIDEGQTYIDAQQAFVDSLITAQKQLAASQGRMKAGRKRLAGEVVGIEQSITMLKMMSEAGGGNGGTKPRGRNSGQVEGMRTSSQACAPAKKKAKTGTPPKKKRPELVEEEILDGS